jgi:hypothetical protein
LQLATCFASLSALARFRVIRAKGRHLDATSPPASNRAFHRAQRRRRNVMLDALRVGLRRRFIHAE